MTVLPYPVQLATIEGPSSVDHLSPISLDDLNAAAALQERVDRKYVLTEHELAEMLDDLGAQLSVLEIDGRRSFGYESMYFDTDDFDSYRGAAYRRRTRFKVRTRSYLESRTTMLEVKTKGARGQTVKTRQAYDFDQRRRLDSDVHPFVNAAAGRPGLAATLRPTLTSEYQRTTLVDLAESARLTVDWDLRCTDWTGNDVVLADRVVVETKSSGAPSAADRWLWSCGCRPEKISKFATCLAALHPELPSNKWHRTLNRHFRDV